MQQPLGFHREIETPGPFRYESWKKGKQTTLRSESCKMCFFARRLKQLQRTDILETLP